MAQATTKYLAGKGSELIVFLWHTTQSVKPITMALWQRGHFIGPLSNILFFYPIPNDCTVQWVFLLIQTKKRRISASYWANNTLL